MNDTQLWLRNRRLKDDPGTVEAVIHHIDGEAGKDRMETGADHADETAQLRQSTQTLRGECGCSMRIPIFPRLWLILCFVL